MDKILACYIDRFIFFYITIEDSCLRNRWGIRTHYFKNALVTHTLQQNFYSKKRLVFNYSAASPPPFIDCFLEAAA